MLISRTLSKLQTCAREIEEKYNVKTKIIDIDFANEADVQGRIEAETKVGNILGALFSKLIFLRTSQSDCW